MPDINVDPSFPTHIKTKRLEARLGNGSSILCIRLWCHCAAHHPVDGFMRGYSEAELEALLGWWGEQCLAINAMIDVGFLERVKGGLLCHDWADHQGHLASYHERAKTAAKARWDKVKGHSNATSNALSNAPTKPAIPTKPSKRGEDRPLGLDYLEAAVSQNIESFYEQVPSLDGFKKRELSTLIRSWIKTDRAGAKRNGDMNRNLTIGSTLARVVMRAIQKCKKPEFASRDAWEAIVKLDASDAGRENGK